MRRSSPARCGVVPSAPNRTRLAFCALAFLLTGTMPLPAADTFAYLYTTDTLPKHKFEFEQWITDREGQAHGYYHGLELRSEGEFGITNNLQISLYANYTYIGAQNNSVNHLTEGLDISPDHNPLKPQSGWHSDGASIELLWRAISPYSHSVGLAFYVEPEFGPRENGIETRAIIQKDYMDDRLIVDANVWLDFDNEQGTNLGAVASSAPPSFEKTRATYLEADFGTSYRFRRNWSFGFEFRNHNEYGEWSLTPFDQQHTAFFLGPNVHYARGRWTATFSALRQLHAVGFTDDQKAQIYEGRLYGNEHTTWDGLRLVIGRTF